MPVRKNNRKQAKKAPAKTARQKSVVKKTHSPTSAGGGKKQRMIFRALPAGNTTFKPRRPFGNPVSAVKPNPNFVPIPPTNKQPADLSYNLADAVTPAVIQNIQNAKQLVFHSVGDTGDVNGNGISRELATQMEAQYTAAAANSQPAFFYHLGDVVYYNGVTTDYRDQFYDPYKFYPPVIMAIPGNHDGQTIVNPGNPPDPEPSLKGFFTNFCDSARNPSQSSPYRYTMNQPWPYWVLNTPMATLIGLYSNVDGSLDDRNSSSHLQFSWLIAQLQKADTAKALILAVHHSPFSLDSEHGGYPDILDAIDQATAAAGGRHPDLVLSGHIHNYQRFQRMLNKTGYPYVIAGNGGYASVKTMHHLQVDPKTGKKISASPKQPFQTTMAGVSLMACDDSLPGFLRITIDKQNIRGEYFTNDMTGGNQSVKPFDSFGFDYVNKRAL